jgi:hypothetical protein
MREEVISKRIEGLLARGSERSHDREVVFARPHAGVATGSATDLTAAEAVPSSLASQSIE